MECGLKKLNVTVTTSDPLTKALFPFLLTLCSADLEAPAPTRMFQPRDTEQQRFHLTEGLTAAALDSYVSESIIKGSCHCDEWGGWLMATKGR